ncbi:MAG: WS/DGAT domain-containing protein [Pseudomonadota bacterium]|nr:WS/DGAT domain-containing protein [Pseudomonadota bacterium]
MKVNMTLLDMSWFPLESKSIPVHGGFLQIFTPPAGAKADYARRLLATMKKRAVGAPFNLRPKLRVGGLPYWKEVDVNLDQHLVELRLPSPGTDQQLLAAAAEAIRQPLSWSLPLWRCHWIEGLEGGRFAFMLTVHHSQWDGMSMFRLMSETMSESAESKTIRAPWQGVSTWLEQMAPTKGDKARLHALRRATALTRDVAGAAVDMGKVFSRQARQVISGGGRIALPMAAPESRPERNGSSERTYGLVRFPVARVKAMAKATACSFNDVMTAAIDGAYVAYLDELGIGTKKPLVAMVPIALKVPGAGNQISGALVTLGQPGTSPRKRLTAISESMSTAKADIGAMSAAGAKLYAMINMGVAAAPDLLRIGERLPTSANLLISNPYGVPKPLYLNGSRLDYFVPLIGPSLGTRLMAGIWTYAGETFVSLTSLLSVVPDVERLASLVREAFEELERTSIEPVQGSRS